jgi:hypothetical protein
MPKTRDWLFDGQLHVLLLGLRADQVYDLFEDFVNFVRPDHQPPEACEVMVAARSACTHPSRTKLKPS